MLHPILQKLLDDSIPVSRAQFLVAVNNGSNVPENFFAADSDNASRRVKMFWHPIAEVIICTQKDKWWCVPDSTAAFFNLIDQVDEPTVKRGRPFKIDS